MDIWRKIRRFLIAWGIIFAVLVMLSVIIHGRELYAALSSSAGAAVSSLIVSLVMIGVIIYFLRGIFRG